MKLSPRDQLLVVAIAMLVVVGALVAVLVVPMFGRLSGLDAKIQTATDDVSMARAQLAKRQQIKNDAAVTGDSLLELANAMPENPELPSLIIDLQDTAYEQDVQLTSVKPGDLVPNAGFVGVPIEIQVVGTWGDTIDYLQALRTLTRQVRVVSFSSGRADKDVEEAGFAPYTPVTVINLDAYAIPSSSSTGTAPAAPTAAPGTQQ